MADERTDASGQIKAVERPAAARLNAVFTVLRVQARRLRQYKATVPTTPVAFEISEEPMKRIATLAVAAGALALGLIAITPTTADAGWGRGYYGYGYGYPYAYPRWRGYGWGYGPYARPYYPYAYYPYWRGRYVRRGWGY